MTNRIVAHALSTIAVLSVAMMSTNASAKTVSEALTECGNVENSLKRLVCYDQLVKEMQQYSGLEEAVSKGIITSPVAIPRQAAPVAVAQTPTTPAPATSASSAPAPAVSSQGARAAEENPEEQFGQKIAPDIDKLYYDVSKVVKGHNDLLTVTMANGHKWRQTDWGSFRVKEGDRVYVERGALGSFFLGRDDANRRIRVVRAN